MINARDFGRYLLAALFANPPEDGDYHVDDRDWRDGRGQLHIDVGGIGGVFVDQKGCEWAEGLWDPVSMGLIMASLDRPQPLPNRNRAPISLVLCGVVEHLRERGITYWCIGEAGTVRSEQVVVPGVTGQLLIAYDSDGVRLFLDLGEKTVPDVEFVAVADPAMFERVDAAITKLRAVG